MIGRIIEFSARSTFLILLLIVAIIGTGLWAIYNTPLDAIPDLSDAAGDRLGRLGRPQPQYHRRPGHHPIVTQLLSAPKVKAVRATSFYGSSLIYVIFEDGTDLYWARSRVLEYLSGMAGKLPEGVSPQLGPDATGVGWALEVRADRHDRRPSSLAELRSLQDWQVQYDSSVAGGGKVAGGFVKQYQVTIDPDKLLAYKIPIKQGRRASPPQQSGSRRSRAGVLRPRVHGAWPRLLSETHRHRNRRVGAQPDGTPILIRDVAVVQIGPDIRRGVVDYNGMDDAAEGIVVVRYGESVYDVLGRVKQTIKEKVQPSLPQGVELVVTYDRSTLLSTRCKHSVASSSKNVIVSLVCLVFLFHVRSALVAVDHAASGDSDGHRGDALDPAH